MEHSSNLTGVYFYVLHEIATSGTTFKDKNALVTRVGKGSIGVEIFKGLMSGGAYVVVTAVVPLLLSLPPTKAPNRMWRHSLTTFTRHWDLILTTFNPFAAILKNGHKIDSLDDNSELMHLDPVAY